MPDSLIPRRASTPRQSPQWATVALGDVANNSTISTQTPEEDGFTRYIIGKHIPGDGEKITTCGEVGDGEFGSRIRTIIKPGDVICTTRGPKLRVAIATFDCLSAHTNFVLRTKTPDVLLQEFLQAIACSEDFQAHLRRNFRGSTNLFVNWADAAKYKFALPPIEEQRRMVSALGSVSMMRDRHSAAIDAGEVLLRSACIDFGTALLSNNSIPAMTIEDAGEVRMGRQRSPKYQTGKFSVPYLRVANVYDGFIATEDILSMDFDSRDAEIYRLQDGDVLLNEGNSRELVGRSAIYRGDPPKCCFQNTLIRFRSDKVIPDFAQSFFRFMLYSGRFAAMSKQTSSIAHLGLNRLRSAPIRVPSRAAQTEAVRHIVGIEAKLTGLRLRKDRISSLKAKLVEECIRGVEP